MKATPVMNLAGLRFDRSAALLDGRVKMAAANVVNVPGGKAAIDGLLGGAFDAAEVPLSRYVSWIHAGGPFVAAPVFTDRLFQHEYIYTRTDTGITGLEDLRGRRVVCAPSYFATPSFWHRALLHDEAGIAPHEIEWHSPAAEAKEMRLPEGVTVKQSSASILGLERLLDGTADALMTARTPMVPQADRHRVRRVIANAAERTRQWYARTGYFPILHVVAIRKQALAIRPDFGIDICRAYDESREHCYRVLQDERMTGLPFMRDHLDQTLALCGDDPWPYGLERNGAEIDHFLGLAHAHGLTRRRLAVSELFDARACEYRFESRMTRGCITAHGDGGWAPSPTVPG